MIEYEHPLLRLPLRVDLERLSREVDQFPKHVWSPDRFAGTSAASYTTLALVSYRGTENNISYGPFAPTPFLASCPYARQIIAFFRAPVCEVRLRWLGPRFSAKFHFDTHHALWGRYRIHIPIHTTPHAFFYCGDRVAHMAAGSVWTFDRMRRHAAFNDDPTEGRLHLVLDFAPSETIHGWVQRGSDASEPREVDTRISFDSDTDPPLQFATARPAAVWSPERLRVELDQLRGRFTDDSRFCSMVTQTEALLASWAGNWHHHEESREGWSVYKELALAYYRAWRDLCPPRLEEDSNETNWIACLLETGAFNPSAAPRRPSWSSDETYKLTDTARITIESDGAAKVSIDGEHWRSTPTSGLRALLEVSGGAGLEGLRDALGEEAAIEALPTLHWLADAGALIVNDDAYKLSLFDEPSKAANADVEHVVSQATADRLRQLAERIPHSGFQCKETLHFLVRPPSGAGAYLPHAEGYHLLFADALHIAQAMALRLPVDEVASATGYTKDDDFLLFVTWLWDLLPFECDKESEVRRSSLDLRLQAGQTLGLPILPMDPNLAIHALADSGSHGALVSANDASPASLRAAAILARTHHIDLLLKTSLRATIADLHSLPVAGFVLANCDTALLRAVGELLRFKQARPFIVAIIETMRALSELDEIARSPWVDALMVGAGDLARNAQFAGVDPAATVAHAQERVRQAAKKEGKLLSTLAQDAEDEQRARRDGARLIFRATDHDGRVPVSDASYVGSLLRMG
jgi:hypothetical protein